ncbi:methyltransferase type 11 [Fusarium heterosporum]|uniref:Methyltransferase type 11 n=1 Tax=Fusarium heterosporum TaxID=42747 RepID=A0A8H5SK90_FUSHE|nr:methyltransferase type 11 [Fusarium heterosporum]
MRDPTFIQNWINTVDLNKDTENTADSKTTGKRAYPRPEPEEMSDLTPERTKKRKTASIDDDDEIEDIDAETTPRALFTRSRPAPYP